MSSEPRDDTISLIASQASKITKVSIYSGRAEITRRFIFPIKEGQNQLLILGLPRTLDDNTVRVEGRGKATIHDVAVSRTPAPPLPQVSEDVALLAKKRTEKKKALKSVEEARAALNTYLASLNAREVDPAKFGAIVDHHEDFARKFDLRILELEEELSELAVQAGLEKMKTAEGAQQQTWQVGVNLWASSDEQVELRLQYVVFNADWSATYEIRADTQSQGKNMTILYKAVITQATGESWEGVPLTLETTNPTFGIHSPELPSWNVGIRRTQPTLRSYIPPALAQQPTTIIQVPSRRSRSRSRSLSPSRMYRARSASSGPEPFPESVMHHPTIGASNKGSVAATFEVPGYINIPSDGLKHNVTISRFEFGAALLWYTIPKVDAKTYIKTKIKNESEYRFIPGPANVYVDGSFVATTSMPSVSPEETFNCQLGLDPSIRITYPPREKKATQTGFMKKSSSTTYTQRITLLNTKSTPIGNLKVVDSIPVSQDEQVEVKLLAPSLPPPAPERDPLTRKDSVATDDNNSGKGASKKQKIMRVLLPSLSAKGVVAQWDGTDDPDVDQQAVGRNGRVSWIVSLAPQESATLALKWEVSFPEKSEVYGI